MKKTLAVVSCALPRCAAEILSERFDVLALPPDSGIDAPVSSHPDMIMCRIGTHIFLPRSYAVSHPEVYRALSCADGYTVVLSDSPRNARYPYDISLNCAVTDSSVYGKKLICLSKHTCPKVVKEARERFYNIVNVKQGYAGCSCLVSDKAVLTSDKGIYSALAALQLPAFLCSCESIRLEGYSHGFIGGCGGVYGNELYLFGDEYPNEVKDFAEYSSLTIVQLLHAPLTDYGGMKFI